MAKVTKEQALKEVHLYLDVKKTKQFKRDEMSDSIDLLSEYICDGDVVFDQENGCLIHNLIFPIKDKEGQEVTKTLTYKGRLKNGETHSRLQKLKSNDLTGMVAAYISVLTGEGTGIIKQLDSEDYRISQAIAGFFF